MSWVCAPSQAEKKEAKVAAQLDEVKTMREIVNKRTAVDSAAGDRVSPDAKSAVKQAATNVKLDVKESVSLAKKEVRARPFLPSSLTPLASPPCPSATHLISRRS